MTGPYGLFVLGRGTFDVAYASERRDEALAALRGAGVDLHGSTDILFDNDAVAMQIEALGKADLAGIIVIQATFTDAEAIVRIGQVFAGTLHIWALPEPRTGGRLRLNAFCGLNLAAHALGLRGRSFAALYADPRQAGSAQELKQFLAAPGTNMLSRRPAQPQPLAQAERSAARALAAIRGARIGRLGAHPAGFDTCAYDEAKLFSLAGVKIDPLELDTLFDEAARTSDADAAGLRLALEPRVSGLAEVDQVQLDRSLRLKSALGRLKEEGAYSAFAVRCWPECFTEYGGAVCGPVAMMGQERTPCACEADVYGALTSLMLQEIADAPAFLVDIVDMDARDDTTVVWHCGQAPLSMADPAYAASATVHSNRRMPLLFQFPLKPGRVTLARISQARGETAMAIATGEVLAAPPSYSGTSGVVRFDAPASLVRERLLEGALEHHLALVYGDHADAVEHVAHALSVPVLDLTE